MHQLCAAWQGCRVLGIAEMVTCGTCSDKLCHACLVLVELLEAQPRAALSHAALRAADHRDRQLAEHLLACGTQLREPWSNARHVTVHADDDPSLEVCGQRAALQTINGQGKAPICQQELANLQRSAVHTLVPSRTSAHGLAEHTHQTLHNTTWLAVFSGWSRRCGRACWGTAYADSRLPGTRRSRLQISTRCVSASSSARACAKHCL